jgi:hypothetical protein
VTAPDEPREPNPPARRPSWSRRLLIGLAAVLLPELFSNTFANAFSDTSLGKWLSANVATVVIVLVVVVGVLLAVLFVVERRRPRPAPPQVPPQAPPDEPPEPVRLPVWYRFQVKLHGREREIEQALDALRFRGIVVLAGPRDVGTSSVANQVVAKFLADAGIDGADAVVWVDLRGQSSTEPPGARAVAGRLMSTFNLDEPADETRPVLAAAAERLLGAMRERATVLLLDNVFHADQVSWLTRAWPSGGRLPVLVVAGDRPVASAVEPTRVVPVEPLHLSAMRAILSDELDENWLRRIAGTMRGLRRDLLGDRSDQVEDLLRTFRGRPRAVREIARLVRTAGNRPWSFGSLLDDTSGVAPLVAMWRAVLPELMQHTLSPHANDLIRALAVLPVTGLDREALDTLAPHVEGPGYHDPVDELCQAGVVQESPPGRFRLPEEVRVAHQRVEARPVPDEVWTAVARLVRHYATQAARWSAALRAVNAARPATVWLHQEEPLLRALLTDWRDDAQPPESLVDDLAAIADALDVWYIRELQSDGLVRTSRGLAVLAESTGRDALVRLAALRTAAAHRIGTHLDLADQSIGAAEPDDRTARHPAGPALRARWHHERGLIEFDRAAAVDHDQPAAVERLQAAEAELHRALALVPEDDLSGRLCVLVNLAAVALEQHRVGGADLHHRLFAALEFLDGAETLAGACADLSGAAHIVELQGVAAIRGGNAPHAVARWQQALALYRDLGEEQGEARCLRHLGTLAVVSPDIAGLLDTGHRLPVGPDRAATVARDYLLRSKRLLAGQPNLTLVDHYLDIAERRLAR